MNLIFNKTHNIDIIYIDYHYYDRKYRTSKKDRWENINNIRKMKKLHTKNENSNDNFNYYGEVFEMEL